MAQPVNATSTISLSSSGTVNMGELNPSASTSASGTGTDALTLTTNCASGYYIYASAANGGITAMSGSNGGTISTSSNAMGSANTLNDNTWGLTASASDKNSSKFSGLPTYANATKTALYTGSTSASSAQIPVYYGVKVNSSLTPGTYTGNVLYTALVKSECYTYTVNFNGNGGTTSSSATSTTQEINRDTETTLTSNPFTRDGYNFLGWATSEANATAKTVAYEDGAKVTNLAAANSSITLWAVWEEDIAQCEEDGNCMQNWTGCDALADNEIVELVDKRNNVAYKVKKVVAIDGSTTPDYAECWMVENLRLTPGNSDPGTTTAYKNDETLKLTTSTSQGSGTITFKEDLGTDVSTTYARYDGDENSATYGAYYQWEAAKLVCPAGWHLPFGGEGGEFANLDIALGGTGKNRTANNMYELFGNSVDNAATPGLGFTRAGYYNGNQLRYTNSRGHHWAYTSDPSNGFGHSLFMMNGGRLFYPQSYDANYYGQSVHCVAGKAYYYLVSYDANGGSGAATTHDNNFAGATSAKPGAAITLATDGTLAKEGYTFQGWGTSISDATIAYASGEKSVSVDALVAQTGTPASGTITLYAVWKKDPTNFTTESICTSAGGLFLADNKCWKVSDSEVTWADRATACTGNWTVPSPGDYDALVTAYGGSDNSGGTYRNGKRVSSGNLYTALGLSANTYFYSSQEVASKTSYAFRLNVFSSYSASGVSGTKADSYHVLCLAS